jgi:hypothetical protein
MTISPEVVHTRQVHARPRLFKNTSKTERLGIVVAALSASSTKRYLRTLENYVGQVTSFRAGRRNLEFFDFPFANLKKTI